MGYFGCTNTKSDIFCMIQGNSKDTDPAEFIILFCTETNGFIHFDILQPSENSYKMTTDSLPSGCESFWPIRGRPAVYQNPANSHSTQPAPRNTEFFGFPLEESELHSPFSKVPPQKAKSSNMYPIYIPEIVPCFSGLLADWRHVISSVFVNTDRDSFSTVLPSNIILPFFSGIHSSFQSNDIDQCHLTKQTNEFKNIMCTTFAACFNYLEMIHKIEERHLASTTLNSAINPTQSMMMNTFTTKCKSDIYTNMIVLQFSRFVTIITTNHAKLHDGAEVPWDLFYRHLGVDVKPFDKLSCINNWYLYPESAKITTHAAFTREAFVFVYEFVIDSAKKCRNQICHTNVQSTQQPVISPSFILLMLSFIAAASNHHPVITTNEKYCCTHWN